MPISALQLLRDEASALPNKRYLTCVEGALTLADTLAHIKQVGAWGVVVVRRSDGAYDLLDLNVVKAPGERETSAAAQALRGALSAPVEACPVGRTPASVVEQAALSTRAAYAQAQGIAVGPKVLVVVHPRDSTGAGGGAFYGALRGDIALPVLTRVTREGYVAADEAQPARVILEAALKAGRGQNGFVFIHMADGTWRSCDVWEVAYYAQCYGADAPLAGVPGDALEAWCVEDLSDRQAEARVKAHPRKLLLVVGEEGGLLGFVGDLVRGAHTLDLQCPNPDCMKVGHVTFDLKTGKFTCGACGAVFEASKNIEAGIDPENDAPLPRTINPAFVSAEDARVWLAKDSTLKADTRYYFRLDIGPRAPENFGQVTAFVLESASDYIPDEGLPLDVALFNDGFAAVEQDMAGLMIYPQGPAVVRTRAARPNGLADTTLARYMYFAVRTPAAGQRAGLRVCLYLDGNLLQSMRIGAQITADGAPAVGGLEAEQDFCLSEGLAIELLQKLTHRRLNIMLNENQDGTHGLRLMGAESFKTDFELTDAVVATMLSTARTRLKQAMYDTKKALEELRLTDVKDIPDEKLGPYYRYIVGRNTGDEAILSLALKFLAESGSQLFTGLFENAQVAGETFVQKRDVRRLVLRPATLQFSVKDGKAWDVPWALVYDRRLIGPADGWQICREFLAAVRDGADLSQQKCFQGNCPNLDNDQVVCPSGFWGYRHILETLPSLKTGNVAMEVKRGDGPALDVGLSMDPKLTLRDLHIEKLKKHVGAQHFGRGTNLRTIRQLLSQSQASMVYFFCHGGRNGATPYLLVGDPGVDEVLQVRDLSDWELDWRTVRPLVFINGCHTTDMTPGDLLGFAQVFMQGARAAAVIGTEVTIVEVLAVEFGEAFIGQFLGADAPGMGTILRDLRLGLLKQYNPLGLVYTPYGSAGLKLA